MKRIILFIIILPLFYISCNKDKGNYDYIPEEELFNVKIELDKDEYLVATGERLHIVPEISGLKSDAKYSYTWVISGDTKDTISNNEILDVVINLKSRTNAYNAALTIRDIDLDVFTRKSFYIRVTSIPLGWYILKEKDGKVDFDFVPEIDSVGYTGKDEMRHDVLFAKSPELPLKGEPVKIQDMDIFRYTEMTETGLAKATSPALVILTSKDMKVFDANGFNVLKKFDELFYGDIPVCSPKNIHIATRRITGFIGANNLFFINGNSLYKTYASYNTMFALPANPAIETHETSIAEGEQITVFDKKTRTFYRGTTLNNDLSLFTYKPEEQSIPRPLDMNMDLVKMVYKKNKGAYFYSLMSNKDNPSDYSLLDMRMNGKSLDNPIKAIYKVSENSLMPKADVHAGSESSNCLYFAKDNVLSYYLPSHENSLEKVIKTFPSDEKITYVNNVQLTTSKSNDQLVVITNSSKGWKLYRFKVLTGNPDIEPNPLFVFEGKGVAKQALFK